MTVDQAVNPCIYNLIDRLDNMADNVQVGVLLETLLEQDRAIMQAALDQQFQGSFTRHSMFIIVRLELRRYIQPIRRSGRLSQREPGSARKRYTEY